MWIDEFTVVHSLQAVISFPIEFFLLFFKFKKKILEIVTLYESCKVFFDLNKDLSCLLWFYLRSLLWFKLSFSLINFLHNFVRVWFHFLFQKTFFFSILNIQVLIQTIVQGRIVDLGKVFFTKINKKYIVLK